MYVNVYSSLCPGAPLIIHPGRNEQSPFDILNVLEEAGADLSRTVMSHLDRTMFDDQRLLELAKRGCYLEYDLFGVECSHYQVVQCCCVPILCSMHTCLCVFY